METNGMMEKEEIYSKVLRAGRRTYFFDVRATKAGDYYLTVTESKKFTNDDGSFHYKKHKIYIYKEDFSEFNSILAEMTDYIIAEKGDEVISERHQKDFKKEYNTDTVTESTATSQTDAPSETVESRFTDVDFDDI
ncbi:PUR family DNA/RNA-binding protein [Oceanihabitans sp. 2_MG-2023]|uniref:PUR family DNA/RNA-binding protein n=1 Tax=Oceanihabitans sp. 2_MG-2023 TaxID=3062661 RepID=UPI0026E2EFDF|nr:PUR family DNA/RNA-binding protein [Oceanihabitans sp. 2_MG-2023]MDO6597130.1 PUR family DNA/RNA-binding protein [Oceanihabitans sp. 2_MG-2023]